MRYSGIISVIVSWLFVVAPAVVSGIDGKKDTISTATKNAGTGQLISFGLIAGTVFQIIFLFYLTNKYQFPVFRPGPVMFFSTCIASFLVALLPEQKHFKLHNLLVKYYFIFHPISLLFISRLTHSSQLWIFTIIVVTLYFVGSLLLIKSHGICARVEQWAFLLLSFWTGVFSI